MANIFTFPGKLGDCLLQWPVAYQWAKQHNEKITLWLDAGTLRPLERLLAAQELVECVELKPGVKSYQCGGQPWDFGLKTEDFVGHRVVHLGFRGFPQRQITLQTALDSGLQIDQERLATERSIHVQPLADPPAGRYVVVHGTFQSHMSGVPHVWRFLRRVHKDLEARFDRIIFVGTPDERSRATDLYRDYEAFDDTGDFLPLAQLVVGASLVIAAGSSNAALAGALKVPTLRVHDPLGDAPRVIWSNLGERQWNEPETDLRRLWPEILEKTAGVPVASPSAA